MRDAKYKLEELGRSDGKPGREKFSVAEPEREDERSQSMSGKHHGLKERDTNITGTDTRHTNKKSTRKQRVIQRQRHYADRAQ